MNTDFICTRCGDSKVDKLYPITYSVSLCDECYTPENEDSHVSEREDGKKLFIIKDYRIWALDYKSAQECLLMIEGF